MKSKATLLLALSCGLVLAGCGLVPQPSSRAATSDSSAQQQSSSEKSAESSPKSSDSSKSSSIDPIPSSSEDAGPSITIPVGEFGRVDVEPHQYATVKYHIAVPYETNWYAFPKPTLSSYQGDYHFVYSDSENIAFKEEGNELFIRLKYKFGGFFNMEALDENNDSIAKIYLQAETTQVGRGEIRVETTDGEAIKENQTVVIAPNSSIGIVGYYNSTRTLDMFEIEDSAIASLNVSTYFVTIKGLALGKTKISANLTQTDAKGDSYNYSFSFYVEVFKDTTLQKIELEGNEVYLYNNEVRYNGDVIATYADKSTRKLSVDEVDVTLDQDGLARFSYTFNGVTKEATYQPKEVSGKAYDATKVGFDFHNAWANYGTGMSTLALSGEVKLLVIPVWFKNSDTFFSASSKDEIRADIEEMVLGENRDGFESLKTFYEKESGGKVSISATIAPWYEDDYDSTLYNDQITSTATGLATRATIDYFSNHTDDDKKNYDRSNDGKVDGLIMMYAANFYGQSKQSNNSVAFCHRFNNSGVGANEHLNSYSLCPVGGMYGFDGVGTEAQRTAADLSKVNPRAYANGSTTIIHEVGHMFGAKDLYTEAGHNYAHQTEEGYEPAGFFSMQDNNVGSHDPLQTMLYSWADPIVFSAQDYEKGQTVDVYIDDFQSGHAPILLSNDWNALNSPFDEYMLLELFSPTGLNQYHAEKGGKFDATGNGIRLWHADAAMQYANNGKRVYDISRIGLTYLADNHNLGDNRFHFLQYIRNDEAEDYQAKSTLNPSGLFHAGDSFSMERFASQTVNGDGILNSGKKLGWEFEVTSIFHNGSDKYGGTIRLTRVDDTITEFKASTNISATKAYDVSEVDVTEDFGLDENHLSLTLKKNDATENVQTEWQSPNYLLLLDSATNHNGSSALISMKPQEDCRYLIKKITVYYVPSTTYTERGVPTVIVNGSTVDGTALPYDSSLTENDPLFMCMGYEYGVNAQSVTIANQSEHTLQIASICIEYSIIPNSLIA